MTIFLDTANLTEITKFLKWGFIKGITTNQKLWFKEKGIGYFDMLKVILETAEDLPVSIELTKTEADVDFLIKEAKHYEKLGSNAVIKVPMLGDGKGIRVAKELVNKGIPVNMTCCMSLNQAILAAELEVDYVSLFYNRIIDYCKGKLKDPEDVTETVGTILFKKIRRTFDVQGYNTLIIAGSIREPEDVGRCLSAGVHIVTVPPEILEKLPYHPKTEETVKEFDICWKKFNEG